jgi:hypothetical protein
MPTPRQLTRMAHVMGWIRTAKENLPAINHGPNAVTAEQIARLSALLDRMHRRALALSAQAPVTHSDERVAAPGETTPAAASVAAAGRRAA